MKIFNVRIKYQDEENNELYRIYHTVAESEGAAGMQVLNSPLISDLYKPQVDSVSVINHLADCVW